MADAAALSKIWIAILMYTFTLIIIVPVQSFNLYKFIVSRSMEIKGQFPEMVKWMNIIALLFWLVYHPLRFLIDISPFSFIYPYQAHILRQFVLHLWNFIFWSITSLGLTRYFLLYHNLQSDNKYSTDRNKIYKTSFYLFLFFFLGHSTFQVIFYQNLSFFVQHGIYWDYVIGAAFIVPIACACFMYRYAPSKALTSELRIAIIYAIIVVPVCTVIDGYGVLDNLQDIDIYQLSNIHPDAYKYNHRAHRCQSNLKRCIIGECVFSLGIFWYMLLTTCYFPWKYRVMMGKTK